MDGNEPDDKDSDGLNKHHLIVEAEESKHIIDRKYHQHLSILEDKCETNIQSQSIQFHHVFQFKAIKQLEDYLVEAQKCNQDNRQVDHDVGLRVLHKKGIAALDFLEPGISEGAVTWEWEWIVYEILQLFEIQKCPHAILKNVDIVQNYFEKPSVVGAVISV